MVKPANGGRIVRNKGEKSLRGLIPRLWKRGRRFLSVSMGERTLWVAEIAQADGGLLRGRVVEFAYSTADGLDDPQRLGSELAEFLRANGFSSRRAVFGVPGKWLMARPFEMPPADEETVSSVLWLHTTENVIPTLGPMVFDYSGEPSPSESRRLLLIGLQQRRMEQITALAGGAKLKVAGITPIGSAVGSVAGEHGAGSLIALFGPGGLEFIEQENGQTRSIQFVRSNGSPQPVLAELRRRSATMLNAGGELAAKRQMVLWDDVGMDGDFLLALKKGSELSIVEASRKWAEISETQEPAGCRGSSALALGRSAMKGLGVDFAHPRLAPAQKPRPRPLTWLASAVAAAALVLIAAFVDLSNLENQNSGLDDRLHSMQPAVDAARPYVASMQFADSFGTARPRYVACIADLTAALPADGQTYLTRFSLRGDMSGEVSGTSPNEQGVLSFRDQLNSTARFSDLECKLNSSNSQARPGNAPPNGAGAGGGAPSPVSFSLTFGYLPAK
jgi:hypothetical protein